MQTTNQTHQTDSEETSWLRARVAELEAEVARLKMPVADRPVPLANLQLLRPNSKSIGIAADELYALLMQAPVTVVVQRGPEHIFELLNPAGLAILGGRDVIGLTIREALPEAIYHDLIVLMDRVYQEGQPFYVHEQSLEFKQPDGTVKSGIFNIFYQPWRDLNQQIAGVMTLGVEVTEQKLMEAALQRSEELFREVQEASLDGFILLKTIYDAQNEIVDFEYEYFNPAAARLKLRSLKDQQGKRLRAEYVGSEDSGLFDQYRQVALTGQPSVSEIHYHYDGLAAWFRISVVKLNKGIAVFFTDITDRKRVEEDQRFLAEVSKMLVSSLDYETNLHQVARKTIGYLADCCIFDLIEGEAAFTFRRLVTAHIDPAKEAIVQEIDHKYSPDPASPHPLVQVLSGNQPLVLAEMTDEDLQKQAHDVEHLELLRFLNPRSVVSLPLVVRGRLVGAFSLISEQPGRYHDQSQVALASEMAQRASVAIDNALLYEEAQKALVRQKELDFLKDQFLSMVSHDLRTPLTSIKGYAQVVERQLQKYTQLSEMTRPDFGNLSRSTSVIVHQAGRMQELIVRLLEFSNIQAARLELKYTQGANLVAFVQQVVEQQNVGNARSRVRLQTNLTELQLAYDEARLEQVLDNLIGNALKYSPPDQPVVVGIEQKADEVVVWVRDQGIGVAPQQQKHLFEQFYRVRNAQTNHIEGLGLGLYITAEIVHQHKGRIWIESAEGQGSTFYLSLPLA